MLASFSMDATFRDSIETNAWWMGEKYDGMRCCWNPTDNQMYTRKGRKLFLLPATMDCLPSTHMDSELWFGRGQFLLVVMIVTGATEFHFWDSLRMVSFDVPTLPFQEKPFEERFRYLQTNVAIDHPCTVVVSRILCRGSRHLSAFIRSVIGSGGEGLILRQIGSTYVQGRTSSLIKLKGSTCDMEGLVVGIRRNSVQLKLPSGSVFSVPSHNVRIPTPRLGEIVSFSCESNSRAVVPANAEIFRVRPDLSWVDLVRDYQRENKVLPSMYNEAFSNSTNGTQNLVSRIFQFRKRKFVAREYLREESSL